MRDVRALGIGICLIVFFHFAGIAWIELVARFATLDLMHQRLDAFAATIGLALVALAIETWRRDRGLRPWSWYVAFIGAVGMATFGAAYDVDVLRDFSVYLFDGIFFIIAAPVLQRWRARCWKSLWACVDRCRDRAKLSPPRAF